MRVRGLLHAALSFSRAERRNIRRYDVPWGRRLWLYRHGFLSSRDAIWNLSAETIDDYLSDLEWSVARGIDEPYDAGLRNKPLFHLLVGSTHRNLLPDVYGLIRDGDLSGMPPFDSLGSLEDLLELLEREPVVVKPATAAKGDAIHFVEQTDDGVSVDEVLVPQEGLLDHLAGPRDRLVMEFVSQADYAAAVYSRATNTVRMLTMVDPKTGDPFIASATHRFGTRASGRIDNWSAGGISAGVDVETGRLGEAVAGPEAEPGTGSRLENHPDTGIKIVGTEVPAWDRVKARVLDLMEAYAGLWPHVGWDVVVQDDSGSIAVLEGEHQSVDSDLQAHHPLLDDERVERFYRYHGVLEMDRLGKDSD